MIASIRSQSSRLISHCMLPFLGRKSANTLPDRLELFPLGTTLFPGGRLALKVFEQRYLELAKARIADGQLFGIVTLTGGGEVGAEQTFAKVGTAVRVASFDMPQAGIFQLDVVGEDRFEILDSTIGKTGLHRAAVRWILPEPKVELPAPYAELRELLSQIINRAGAEKFAEPFDLDDATWVGSRLVEILQLPPSIKQSLLEINDAGLRLKTVYQLISRVGNDGSGQPTGKPS